MALTDAEDVESELIRQFDLFEELVQTSRRVDLNADRVDGKAVTQLGVNSLQRIEVESPTNNSSPK